MPNLRWHGVSAQGTPQPRHVAGAGARRACQGGQRAQPDVLMPKQDVAWLRAATCPWAEAGHGEGSPAPEKQLRERWRWAPVRSIWSGMSVALRGHSSAVAQPPVWGSPEHLHPWLRSGRATRLGSAPTAAAGSRCELSPGPGAARHGRAFDRRRPSVAVWGLARALQGPGSLLCPLPRVPLPRGTL